MKKILGFALALIIVASSFASCMRNIVEDNGSESYNDTNNYITQESSLASDTPTEEVTDTATEKATDDTSDGTVKDDNKDNKETEDNNNNDNENDNENENEENTTVTPTLNINGTVKEWDLEEGISETFKTAANLADTKFDVNIPVSEAGSYKLNFDTSLGFTEVYASGSKRVTLSLPKTVFKEGEPIPVAYSTSGLTSKYENQNPWLCIAKNVNGVDKYVNWDYIPKNTSGIVDARLLPGVRQDESLLDYVWLPVGEYKIYFIDDSYSNLQNPEYWLHDEPICISIVPENSVGTTVTRSSLDYGDASISVANNIFCQGANVVLKYTANNLKNQSGGAATEPWLAIAKTVKDGTGFYDYYTHWDYTKATETGTREFNASNGNSAQTQVNSYKSLPVGSYKIYYVHGSSLQSCINYVEPIGINIVNGATLKAKLGSTSLLNTNSPYDISNVEKDITVTEADVEKGYVTVSFSFASLQSNTTYFLNVQNISLSNK